MVVATTFSGHELLLSFGTAALMCDINPHNIYKLRAEIEVPVKEFTDQVVCHRLSVKPNLPLHNMCICTLKNYEYTVN